MSRSMSRTDGFIDRWSRRKAESREEAPEPAPAEDRAPPAETPAETPEETPEETPLPAAELPDIESLDRESDFAAFMRAGVPEALRKQALRRLWRLDPAFSKLDGLLEYGEDYNAPSRRPPVIRTAWRIGRGMARDEPQEAADGSAEAGQEADGPPEEAAGGAGGETAPETAPEAPAPE